MDKNKVQGAVDDAAGRVKRQVGEWTGDTDAQVEGAAQQVKGKVEKAVGTVNDAARKVENDLHKKVEEHQNHSNDEAARPYVVNRH